MSNFDMYQNSGYINKRNRKKTLILDINDTDNTYLGSGTEFNIKLKEPLTIDKHSEIYLDNFLTFNCNLGDSYNHSAFALKINEFNISSGVASNTSSNTIDGAIVIPNDNNNIDNYFGTVVHKGKKFNYICDINPCTISSITGKITDLTGDPIFHGSATDTKFTYAITNIANWGATGRYLLKNELVTSILTGGGDGPSSSYNNNILTNTIDGATTVFFTTDAPRLTETDFLNQEIVIILPTQGSLTSRTITLTTANNPSMQLLVGNGRFISEFSIISRE